MQIDKIYILLKFVPTNGDLQSLFIAIGQQTVSGSKGLMEAVRNGIINNIEQELYAIIMSKVTSVCADRANVNKGNQQSLWTELEAEIQKYRSDGPFIKLWCSAHQVDLVWYDLTKSNTEIQRTLNILSSMVTYFHKSSLRVEALKKVAAENQFTLLFFPNNFETRWTE